MLIAKTECGHIRGMMGDNVQGWRFLDSGNILNIPTGAYRMAPVLRRLKETPSGRLTVQSDWLEVKFCPECGDRVKFEERP